VGCWLGANSSSLAGCLAGVKQGEPANWAGRDTGRHSRYHTPPFERGERALERRQNQDHELVPARLNFVGNFVGGEQVRLLSTSRSCPVVPRARMRRNRWPCILLLTSSTTHMRASRAAVVNRAAVGREPRPNVASRLRTTSKLIDTEKRGPWVTNSGQKQHVMHGIWPISTCSPMLTYSAESRHWCSLNMAP
jgi:hypothetical protein